MKHFSIAAACLLGGLFACGQPATAQELGDDLFNGAAELGGFESAPAKADASDKSSTKSGGGFDEFGFGGDPFGSPLGGQSLGLGGSSAPKVTVTATPEKAGLGEVVTLRIHLDIPPGGHTYAQDRTGKAPATTQIAVKFPPALEPLDTDFTADREPEVKESPGLGAVSQFEDEVTWSRRFRVVESTGETADLTGLLDYQICDTSCVPYEESFTVTVDLTGAEVDPSSAQRFQPRRGEGETATADPVHFQAELFPTNPEPGSEAIVALTLELDSGWKTFGLTKAETQSALPTEIATTRVDGLKPLDETWRPVLPPEGVKQPGGGVANEHYGRVTWQKRFTVGEEPIALAGAVTYQLCSDAGECLPPNDAKFALGDAYEESLVASAPASFYADPKVFAVADEVAAAGVESVKPAMSVPSAFLWAFVGGLVMNFMPCVLPVLAIKIMGFIQQAGESRRRILTLNLAFSLGVLLVFLAFGLIAVFLGFSMGDQFKTAEFTIAMVILVFVSGLGLFGVFELPVPGFLGNVGADHKEGHFGAFLTGVLATVLATPCVGYFIGGALGLTATLPAATALALWATAGVGMASPFLLAGCFPQLVEYLPKPGMWMVSFKQACGFLLMGTVVWLIGWTGLSEEVVMPLLAFLVGLGMACWLWGTVRPHAEGAARVPAWGSAAAVTAASAFFAVWLASENENELPWQPFSDATLAEMLEDGETVLVDFTAEWCLICKQNENVALNTVETRAFVDEYGIKTLMADFTKEDPAIKAWLDRFGTIGVPLTVIFPEGDIDRAIKFDGPYTQGTLLTALREAVGASPIAMGDSTLPWQDFTEDRFDQSVERKETILLHVGADWDVTAKMNEDVAFDTNEVLRLVVANNIRTLYADVTDSPADVLNWIGDEWGSLGSPFAVVIPNGDIDGAIPLKQIYTREALINALRSATDEKSRQVAMAE